MQLREFPGQDDLAVSVDFRDVLQRLQNPVRRFVEDETCNPDGLAIPAFYGGLPVFAKRSHRSKTRRVGNPEAVNAARIAEGPGTGTTRIPGFDCGCHQSIAGIADERRARVRDHGDIQSFQQPATQRFGARRSHCARDS